jgi:AcrR family transcriptional regulator
MHSRTNGTSRAARAAAAPQGRDAVPTLDKILDAAEQVFGTLGYEGASMRVISERAKVAQSLLHYHFDNKERLYEEVFRRRSAVVTSYRRERLEELFRRDATLEDVLEIFATSIPHLFENKKQSAYYLRMVTEVTLAGDERSQRIAREFLDPTSRDLIAALERVLPSLTREKAVWAYLFSVGARQQAHAQNGRAQRLGATLRDPDALLIPFLVRAISGLAEEEKAAMPKGSPRLRA